MSILDFVVPSDGTAGPPKTWRRSSVAPDQGGDGQAAYNYMVRKMGVCADLSPDMSHGVNNDIGQFYGELSLKRQMLLWLAVFNIPVGPWSTDARWQQCRSALQDIYQKHDWRDVPLFEAMAHSMLSDPKYADVAGEEDAYGCLLERLAEDSPWRRKGVKLVRSRFMAFSRKATDEMRQASSRGFGYLLTCLELGLLGDTNLKGLEIRGEASDAPPPPPPAHHQLVARECRGESAAA